MSSDFYAVTYQSLCFLFHIFLLYLNSFSALNEWHMLCSCLDLNPNSTTYDLVTLGQIINLIRLKSPVL